MNWKTIDTAPREKELLVGKYVNDQWQICQSGYYYDAGNPMEGEPPYWFWHCDCDSNGVTDDEGPTHWMELPKPPREEQ